MDAPAPLMTDEKRLNDVAPPPPLAARHVAAIGDDEVLSLPPPPSHPDMDDDHAARSTRTPSDDDAPHSSSSVSATAAKASSAAFSLAAAAKSKLAQGGRMMLSPLVQTGSSSHRSNEKATGSSSSSASSPATAANASAYSTSAPSSVSSIGYGIALLPGAAASSLGSLLFSSPGSATTSTTASTTSPGSAVDSSEIAAANEAAAAAATAAAEEFRQVSAQQRMQILEDLVQCRRSDWSYIKAMHEGTNYWLNIALLREQQVLAHLGEKQTIRRSVQFFYLGLGLGRLISEFNHPQFLAMEGCQLLEELEFYFASSAVQGMKLMVATSSTLHEPCERDDEESRYSLHEPFRPTIYKWNQRPVFRRLVTPPIPFPLDYREVMLSLCDILAIIYSKLVEDNNSSENIHLFQAIIRFDEKIKKLMIDPVKKEFSAVALQVLTDEIASVRKVFGSGSNVVTSPTSSSAPTQPSAAATPASSSSSSA
uniref:Uncharacterized protein n=1 Tax=Globisporangium ultimum (strain ATCC 200006 / CBS 805.95 / DAOM BR144) TaxID=431595 RepID=K3WIZ2_GLOUD